MVGGRLLIRHPNRPAVKAEARIKADAKTSANVGTNESDDGSDDCGDDDCGEDALEIDLAITPVDNR